MVAKASIGVAGAWMVSMVVAVLCGCSGRGSPNGTQRPHPSGPAMYMEGAVLLGIGGDNSNKAAGYFFEGVITTGVPTDAVMNLVQSNIVGAAYGGP